MPPTQRGLHPNSGNLTLRYQDTLAAGSPGIQTAGHLPIPNSDPATGYPDGQTTLTSHTHMSCVPGCNHTITHIHTPHLILTALDHNCTPLSQTPITPPAGVTTGSSPAPLPGAHKLLAQRLRPHLLTPGSGTENGGSLPLLMQGLPSLLPGRSAPTDSWDSMPRTTCRGLQHKG